MSSRREETDIDDQAADAVDDHGERAVQSEGAEQHGPVQKGEGPIDLVGNQMGDEVDIAPIDAGSAETTDAPDPAAQRVPLFTSDGGTKVYAVKTEDERYLPVTALVVPLGSESGAYGGFAHNLERELPRWAWRWRVCTCR